MQRTRRRLTCSRASASSLSNASTLIRPGSRTSSAGGDCVAISRGFNRYSEIADAKMRIRPTKYSTRLALANQKTSKKTRKAVKSRRPKFETFQNAVVLAPFHTLKKCFQTKLIDLYSNEKFKNLNNKMKLAKKQNVMFEYDVLEVKPPGNSNNRKTGSKKEAIRKKKPAAKKKDKKSVSNSRAQVYCQCDTVSSGSKPVYKNAIQSMRTAKRNLRSRVRNEPTISDKLTPRLQLPLAMYPSSNSQRQKKRRIDNQILASPLLKNNLEFNYPASNGNLMEGTSNSRTSNVSSKDDSWETFSDTPSLQEEHMEGSLAISTTSFDSCMEQSNHSQPQKSYRRYNTRFRMIKSAKDKKADEVFGFPPKPNTDQSRHLIMNVETRNSDNRINDFLDREPQTQGIGCVDIPQNLQPLPKLSRTKGKKQVPETSSSYYLRSMKEVVDSRSQTSNQNLNFSQRASQTQKTLASNSRRQLDEESKRRRINQNVNTPDSARKSNMNMIVNKQQQGDKQTHFLFQGPTKTVEESYSQTDETFIPPNANLSEPSKSAPTHAQTPNYKDNRETSFQVIHERRPTPCSPDSDKESEPITEYGKLETEKQKENFWKGNSSEKKFTEENTKETTTSRIQLPPSMQEPIKYQGSSSMERASTRMREPLDKEPDFIFGPRSNSARLGESCEFTFGLNWVLSDEEDSEHGDRFF